MKTKVAFDPHDPIREYDFVFAIEQMGVVHDESIYWPINNAIDFYIMLTEEMYERFKSNT